MKMTVSSEYIKQAQLLMDVLPDVSSESSFALKGGTAINMFYQDMPRISVDIDLTWLPVTDRSASLQDIDDALSRIVDLINATTAHSEVSARRILRAGTGNPQVRVERDETWIKIETSTMARGTVLPHRKMTTCRSAAKQFRSMEMNVVSFEDVYADKLCAALSRKHPRDLFDVMILYEDEGVTDILFRVFMVYVACSNRLMHELLAPTIPVQESWYDRRFLGMTPNKVPLEILAKAGIQLKEDVSARLTGPIATFLLSLHDAEPDFGLIGFPDAVNLPAVQWKLLHLEKLKQRNPAKHATQRKATEQLFQ